MESLEKESLYTRKLKKKFQYLQRVVYEEDMPDLAFQLLVSCEVLLAILSEYVELDEIMEDNEHVDAIVNNLANFELRFSYGSPERLKIPPLVFS